MEPRGWCIGEDDARQDVYFELEVWDKLLGFFSPEVTDLHNLMPAFVIWDRRFVRLEMGSFIESSTANSYQFLRHCW